MKRPQPFHLQPPGEREQIAQGQGSNRQASYEFDVSQLPTRKQPRVTLTLEELLPFEQLDEQLTADLDLSSMGTMKLMQLSGMLQAVRIPEQRTAQGSATSFVSRNTQEAWGTWGTWEADQYINLPTQPLPGQLVSTPLPSWGALPQTPPATPVLKADSSTTTTKKKTLLQSPVVKMLLGGLIGIALLFLVAHFVNFPATIAILRQHLTTPQGITCALLASAAFIVAFSIRATRWRLFLRPITSISPIKAIQIYWIGIFINVLLPIQGGEVAKSLLLKRVTGTPVSQSLPTVAMDKSLDLMPALVILAIVPFIPGIHMSPVLWFILALVSSILIGVIVVVGLAAWNRDFAVAFIKNLLRLVPKKIGQKIEGFAIGFVDSLLASASRPKTFIPALLLTCLALCCDGLFAMFAFWTVGVYMNFGQAIFGYTTFNMFTILPTPPGQVGSNEAIGTLVFGGLLGFNKTGVLAMFIFSHPLTALIMFTLSMISLAALGLNLSSALKAPSTEEGRKAFIESQKLPAIAARGY
ncbi:MAG TPA: lysylphosphatidylglycerol synthase transmembrane domain-containing protein [Ktedonobacteraceae bacterium]|nr:lysylphosphatidylglycerol synthase transmembrane domain-containing protein [Ktedonobacteraceae bacterium]